MCGILGHFSINEISSVMITKLLSYFKEIEKRGPDDETNYISDNLLLAFHRLSINGMKPEDGQPIIKDGCILICNGEIYNSRLLAEKYDLDIKTDSDCECIPLLYQKFGFKIMVQMLEGVFAIALYDIRHGLLFLARDPVGVRPLFLVATEESVTFASEAKAIPFMGNEKLSPIVQINPGCYFVITAQSKISIVSMKYIDLYNTEYVNHNYALACTNIRELLTHAVHTRCLSSDRPVGAFLSGGLDSSIVAMLAKQVLPELRTFSIGLKDSKDLVYARIAAEAINSKHTEIYYNIEDGLALVPELCRILETCDVTTIRASIPMYILSKYIKENTDIVVLLSGEGADEVFSGYLYNHSAPSSFDLRFDAEIRVSQLPWYDVLRADRTTAHNSLEIRVPFLCKNIVKYAFSINPDFHNPRINKIEKKILRDAFCEGNDKWQVIVSRPKEAFSDGVGYSWKQGITDWAEARVSDDELEQNGYTQPHPKTKEAYLYRKYYEMYYPCTHYVPEYWMPSWSECGNDPSATVLNIHKELID